MKVFAILCLLITLSAIKAEEAVQCDSSHYCPDNTTCCSLGSAGQWGCCPYPNATCCSDHAHCCPNGYQCDLSAGQCVRQEGVNEFLAYVGLMERISPSVPQVNDIGSCIQDIEAVIQDGQRVYNDIQSRNFQDLLAAVNQLIQDGQNAVNDCQSLIKEALKKKSGSITDCINDITSLVHDGQDLANDIQAKDYSKLISDAERLVSDAMNAVNDCKNL